MPSPQIKKSKGVKPIAIRSAIEENLRVEILKWIFSAFAGIVIYLVSAFVILKIYKPDLKELLDLANSFGFVGSASVPRPEPMEQLLFRSGVVIILSSTFLFYYLLSRPKWLSKLKSLTLFNVVFPLFVIFLVVMIFIDFANVNMYAPGGKEEPQNSRDYYSKTNFEFFFNGLFLGDHFYLYSFLIVPLIALLFFRGFKKLHWEDKNTYKWFSSITGYLFAGAGILGMILMDTFKFPYTFENKYDFNAVYYSMTQVHAGVPMLLDGFTNTYGLYPHFLNLIFKIIGLSVFKFTFLMSLLIAVAFIFNFYLLKQLVRNNTILFLGFITVIFFPFFIFRLVTPFDSIFANFPIRYIIPSTLTALAMIYLKLKERWEVNKEDGQYKQYRIHAMYWTIFTIFSFAILWNPEIGMVCYFSWLFMLSYDSFSKSRGRVALRKIIFHWLTGIVVIISAFSLYKFSIYLFYGRVPEFNKLFGYIGAFTKIGFGLLPMQVIHPWNIMALTILTGFLYSFVKWYKNEITSKASIIFLLSMISLGYMVYFQGRSHNWSFVIVSGFFLMLLTILGDELWLIIKTRTLPLLNIVFIIFLFIISFSFFEMVYSADKLRDLAYQKKDKLKQLEEQQKIKSNTEFILKNSHEGERILILTAPQYQGLYFNGFRRLSGFNPGMQDMFLNSDLQRMSDQITDSSFNIFIEPALCNFGYMAMPLSAIGAVYHLEESNLSMSLLEKRKIKIPDKTFFYDAESSLIYRKYNDDKEGMTLRIKDAAGIVNPRLDSVFSVQILFHSANQICPNATLAGNMNSSTGFLISNVLNSSEYFFGINGKGVNVALPAEQWVYCVMNVFPDHVDLFQNGIPSGTFSLREPMAPSLEKLYIGNLGFGRYYLGAISEVAISKKIPDRNKVEETWIKIKAGIK